MNYHTTDLLPDVIDQCAASEGVSDIIVVHNGGSAPLEPSRASAPVQQISLEENVGFAKAVNIGLEHTACPWVLLINPDVRLDPDCVGQLAFWAKRLEAAVVGPRFYWDDARQFRLPPATGGSAGLNAFSILAGQHPLDAALLDHQWAMRHDRFWSAQEPFVEPFLSGACLLIKRAAFGDAGLLDERFFLYYEDTLLCAQATLSGHLPLCVPSAEAVHYWNQSPARADVKHGYMKTSHDTYIDQFYGDVSWPKIDKAEAPELPPISDSPAGPEISATEGAWLEMSQSPNMVPFAQATLSRELRALPDALWARLEPGWYYFRIRDTHGRVRDRWRCRKTG